MACGWTSIHAQWWDRRFASDQAKGAELIMIRGNTGQFPSITQPIRLTMSLFALPVNGNPAVPFRFLISHQLSGPRTTAFSSQTILRTATSGWSRRLELVPTSVDAAIATQYIPLRKDEAASSVKDYLIDADITLPRSSYNTCCTVCISSIRTKMVYRILGSLSFHLH